MDRQDALALLDVMTMQAVYLPPPIDRAKLIYAYLDIAPSEMPEFDDVEPADFWRIPPARPL